MPTFRTQSIGETKQQRERHQHTERIDYRKIPGIVILDSEAAFYNFQVFGQKTQPKERQ